MKKIITTYNFKIYWVIIINSKSYVKYNCKQVKEIWKCVMKYEIWKC